MMDVFVVSERKYQKWASFDTVFEWEDEMTECLDSQLLFEKGGFIGKVSRFFRRLLIKYTNRYSYFNCDGRAFKLIFIMCASDYRMYTRKNYIPVFLDFHTDDVDAIASATKDIPFFFVTSLDIYNLLKEKNDNVVYIPLSTSSKNIEEVEKTIDVIQFGRKNKQIHGYMMNYIKKHPNVEYVFQTEEGSLEYQSTTRGVLGKFNNRKEYLELMAKCKISLVSSPGIENKNKFGDSDFFTPRFYESAAKHCLLLGMYSDNEEARYLDIGRVCPNVKDANHFEEVINQYLTDDCSIMINTIEKWIEKNTTKERCKILKSIIGEYYEKN